MKKVILVVSTACALSVLPVAAFASTASNVKSQSESSSASQLAGAKYPGYVLKSGSRGVYVKELQERLNQLPDSNAGQADGIFGPKTFIAVELFQISHGLTKDGIVGPQTWNALFGGETASTAGGFHHPSQWDENSVLHQGDSGTEVRNVQYILNVMQFYTKTGLVDVDGIFGPKTAQAVKTYQEGNGLTPNGIVDSKTWASFAKYIHAMNSSTYEAGSYMGLRIEWKYDNTSNNSGSTAYIYGDGDHLTDHYSLNG